MGCLVRVGLRRGMRSRVGFCCCLIVLMGLGRFVRRLTGLWSGRCLGVVVRIMRLLFWMVRVGLEIRMIRLIGRYGACRSSGGRCLYCRRRILIVAWCGRRVE